MYLYVSRQYPEEQPTWPHQLKRSTTNRVFAKKFGSLFSIVEWMPIGDSQLNLHPPQTWTYAMRTTKWSEDSSMGKVKDGHRTVFSINQSVCFSASGEQHSFPSQFEDKAVGKTELTFYTAWWEVAIWWWWWLWVWCPTHIQDVCEQLTDNIWWTLNSTFGHCM